MECAKGHFLWIDYFFGFRFGVTYRRPPYERRIIPTTDATDMVPDMIFLGVIVGIGSMQQSRGRVTSKTNMTKKLMAVIITPAKMKFLPLRTL